MNTETYNLSDSTDGMQPFIPALPSNPKEPESRPPQIAPSSRPAEIPKISNAFIPDANNNLNNNKEDMMDATPIADVLSPEEMQQPMQMQQPVKAQAPADSKNPMNLTDEQMNALVAAVAAAITFSGPVQEKLGGSIPNFFTDSGDKSLTGVIASSLVVAIVFYLSQRFVMKR